MQVDSIQSELKANLLSALETKIMDESLSNAAFKFNLRRYTSAIFFGIDPSNVAMKAEAYTRPLFSSTSAVLVTPPRVPLSNRLGENHVPNVSHKICLR